MHDMYAPTDQPRPSAATAPTRRRAPRSRSQRPPETMVTLPNWTAQIPQCARLGLTNQRTRLPGSESLASLPDAELAPTVQTRRSVELALPPALNSPRLRSGDQERRRAP